MLNLFTGKLVRQLFHVPTLILAFRCSRGCGLVCLCTPVVRKGVLIQVANA